MALPRIDWSYTLPEPSRGRVHLPSILKEWHRAQRVGLGLERLAVDGSRLDDGCLWVLNTWLSAGGAWNCGLLPYFEAEARLGHILAQGGPVPSVVAAWSGRAARSTAEKLLWD